MNAATSFACDAYAAWLRSRAEAHDARLRYDRYLQEVTSEELDEFMKVTNEMLAAYEKWERNATEPSYGEIRTILAELVVKKDSGVER